MRFTKIVVAAAGLALAPATTALAHPADFAAIGTQHHLKRTAKGFDFTETVQKGNTRIATDRVICVTRPQNTAACSATFTFRDGSTLRVRGVVSLVTTSTIRIVGGTKRYRGARGSLTLAHLSATKTAEGFTFS